MAEQAHTLEITSTPEGKIISKVKGVSGPSCSALTKWLDELGEVMIDKHTADWFKSADQRLTNRAKGV